MHARQSRAAERGRRTTGQWGASTQSLLSSVTLQAASLSPPALCGLRAGAPPFHALPAVLLAEEEDSEEEEPAQQAAPKQQQKQQQAAGQKRKADQQPAEQQPAKKDAKQQGAAATPAGKQQQGAAAAAEKQQKQQQQQPASQQKQQQQQKGTPAAKSKVRTFPNGFEIEELKQARLRLARLTGLWLCGHVGAIQTKLLRRQGRGCRRHAAKQLPLCFRCPASAAALDHASPQTPPPSSPWV